MAEYGVPPEDRKCVHRTKPMTDLRRSSASSQRLDRHFPCELSFMLCTAYQGCFGPHVMDCKLLPHGEKRSFS